MEVTITLTICLSLVFVITLGIVSCTLRDQNFKARFDKSNERLKRIIKEQHDELISYRETIKKNDDNLKSSLDLLSSASKSVNKRMELLNDFKELFDLIKTELGELNLNKTAMLKERKEFFSSIDSCVNRIENDNNQAFKRFESIILNRQSYISPSVMEEIKKLIHLHIGDSAIVNGNICKLSFEFITLDDINLILDKFRYCSLKDIELKNK